MVQMGDMVLMRTGNKRYAPAVINSINENGSLNLTVFSTNGQVGLARDVYEGPKEGDWCPTGVDAQEAAMAGAPPVSETGKPTHPPPLSPEAPKSTTPLTGTLKDLEKHKK
jgi:hypothetical protein